MSFLCALIFKYCTKVYLLQCCPYYFRVLWTVDGLPVDAYHWGAEKIIAVGDYDTLLLDYSPFLEKIPNARISFRVAIEWIDQEPLNRSISNVIEVR